MSLLKFSSRTVSVNHFQHFLCLIVAKELLLLYRMNNIIRLRTYSQLLFNNLDAILFSDYEFIVSATYGNILGI